MATRSLYYHCELLFWIRGPEDANIAPVYFPNEKDSVAVAIQKQKQIDLIKAQNSNPETRAYEWMSIGVLPPARGLETRVVQATGKEYDTTCYAFIYLPLSPKQVEHAFAFAHKQLSKPFNSAGKRRNFLPWAGRGCCGLFPTYGTHSIEEGRMAASWFCSELCMATLQDLQLPWVTAPCEMTPGDVYHVLTHECKGTIERPVGMGQPRRKAHPSTSMGRRVRTGHSFRRTQRVYPLRGSIV